MGRVTTTTTVCICDRCASKYDADFYMVGASWGQLNLKWHGDKGGRMWDGTAAGINLNGEAWLCEICTDAFLHFMDAARKGEGSE